MTLRSWRVDILDGFAKQRQQLQWGHDLAVMESLGFELLSIVVWQLQWGHDLAVMESADVQRLADLEAGASMGP